LWTAITIVQGGGYLANMITGIWPSYYDFPNTLPASANITSGALLMVVIYWLIQTAVATLPMHRLRWFFLVKSIIVPPTYIGLTIWASVATGGGGPLVTQSIPNAYYLGRGWAVMLGLNAVVGLFSSLSVNMPDFGRFSKNQKGGYYQVIAVPLIGTIGAIAPIYVTSAGIQLYGEEIWYMPAMIANFSSRIARFAVGLSFAIATMGNNIAAGSFPFSNDVSAFAPQYINIFRATILLGIFCMACTPWNIVSDAAGLLSFLSGYALFMSSMAAIIVCDYYIIRKQKLDIREMYNAKGIYYYTYGFHWRAWVAFLIPVSFLLPGLAYSISPTVNVPTGFQELFCISWPFGFATSFLCYYVICKFISPPTASLVSEAVYPPMTEEEEKMIINGIIAEQGSVESVDKQTADLSVLEVKA